MKEVKMLTEQLGGEKITITYTRISWWGKKSTHWRITGKLGWKLKGQNKEFGTGSVWGNKAKDWPGEYYEWMRTWGPFGLSYCGYSTSAPNGTSLVWQKVYLSIHFVRWNLKPFDGGWTHTSHEEIEKYTLAVKLQRSASHEFIVI